MFKVGDRVVMNRARAEEFNYFFRDYPGVVVGHGGFKSNCPCGSCRSKNPNELLILVTWDELNGVHGTTVYVKECVLEPA